MEQRVGGVDLKKIILFLFIVLLLIPSQANANSTLDDNYSTNYQQGGLINNHLFARTITFGKNYQTSTNLLTNNNLNSHMPVYKGGYQFYEIRTTINLPSVKSYRLHSDGENVKIHFIYDNGKTFTVTNPKKDHIKTNLPFELKNVTYIYFQADGIEHLSRSNLYQFNVYTDTAYQDITPPSEISNVNHTKTYYSIGFTWTNPLDNDFKEVIVYRGASQIYKGSGTSFSDGNLDSNKEYTYTFKTVDYEGNVSSGTTFTVKTEQEVTPEEVNNIIHTKKTHSSIHLEWVNPTDKYFDFVAIYKNDLLLYKGKGTSFSDVNLKADTEYIYLFKTIDTNNKYSEGVIYKAKTEELPPPLPPPTLPTGLKGVEEDKAVQITWDTMKNVNGYNVYMDGVKLNPHLLTVAKYNVSGLTNGQSYTFQVSAVNSSGESEKSSIELTPKEPPPHPPLKPTQIKVIATLNTITLSWTKSANTDFYRIYRHKKPNEQLSIYSSNLVSSSTFIYAAPDTKELLEETTDLSFEIENLEEDTQYTFYVSAVNQHGESEMAEIKTKTKKEAFKFDGGFIPFTPFNIIYNAIVLIGSLASFILLGLAFYYLPKIIQTVKQANN